MQSRIAILHDASPPDLHDLAQARDAEKSGADYIGFGPIFGSTTKETGYSARGLEMLRKIREAVKIPVVVIGGITERL